MNFRNLLMGAAVSVAALSLAAAANAAAPDTQTATTSSDATVLRPITISDGGVALSFGKIVKPRTSAGNGTVTITNAASPGISATGEIVLLGSYTRPTYTIQGEGTQTYTLTVPATFALAGPSSSSLTVTLNPSMATGSHTFGGTLGSAATDLLYIGASVPITDATTSGAYSGSYDVTVAYN